MIREKQNRSIEILAPAGSYESFRAAIAAGADAVYAGGPRFGARAFAENFSEQELLAAIDEAHLHHCRFYLTINTLLKDMEIGELPAYLQPLYEGGLDAVIVQDVGVLKLVREYFPQLEIHASTQMSITGVYGASFLKEAGAVRVVPARELSVEEVRQIKQKTGMEVECFVHGALCYCYSGQCLMSSMIGGRSGNRGQCAQPCRLIYESEGKIGHLMSLKDICTLELIPDLIEAGIDSFKIEGRMKRPEYVAGVTAVYRKYTDLYLQYGRDGYHVAKQDKERLMDLYNRGGFHSGYYLQRNGRDMTTPNRPNHAGVAAFRVLSQTGREVTGVALTQIHAGDVLELSTGDESEKRARQDRKDVSGQRPLNPKGRGQKGIDRGWKEYTFGKDCEKGKQTKILVPKEMNIRKGVILSRIRNQKLIDELQTNYVFGKKQEKIYGFLSLSAGKPATLEVSLRDVHVESRTSVNVETAANRPLTEEQIRRQLGKTNDTEFIFEKLDIRMDGKVFLPLQQLNELRRTALARLAEAVRMQAHRAEEQSSYVVAEQSSCTPTGQSSHTPAEQNSYASAEQNRDSNIRTLSPKHSKGQTRISVLAETWEQVWVVLNTPDVERLYLDFDLLEHSEQEIEELLKVREDIQKGGEQSKEERHLQLYVALPYVVRENTVKRLEKAYADLCQVYFDGVLIRNYESYQFLREHGYDKKVVADHPLYVMNHQAEAFWNLQGIDGITLPLELNCRELSVLGVQRSELIVYGYYPVMVSAQCVRKNVSGCRQENSYTELTDRFRNSFKVRLRCMDCYNVIYNPVPLYLYDLTEEIKKISPEWLRFQFTAESAKETAAVLTNCMKDAGRDSLPGESAGTYTRGHFHRGII